MTIIICLSKQDNDKLVFKVIESDVTRSGRALSIFGKEWNAITNDLFKVKGFKNKIYSLFGNGITDSDVEQLKKYNALIKQGVNPQTAFYDALSNSSFAAKNLAASAQGVTVSLQRIEEEANRATIAERIMAGATKALGTALTMALNIGIGLAINFIITQITRLVNKQEEIRQKAKEVADANNEEISSLKDLRKQYLEIIDSSKTLSEKDVELAEWKKTLASKYDIEIDKLKELNYERKIALDLIDEEILKQAKQTFANEDYKRKYDAFLKEYYNADYGNTSAVTHATRQAHIEAKIDNDDFKAISDYLKKEFGISTNASQGIDTSLGVFGSTYSLEIEVNTDEKSLEEAMDVYADALNTINNKKEYFQKEIDQETNKQNKKDLKEKLESWQYYGKAVQDAYNRLEKIKNEYESYKSGIAQDALLRFDDFKKQSKNSVDAIKTEQDAIKWVNKLIEEKSDNIDALAEELRKIAADELPDFKDAILGVGKETNSNTLAVKKLTDAYEDLSEVLDDLFSKQDKLAGLYEKIAKSIELSASEARELIELFPELTSHLVRVGSKWSFDIKGINEAFDKLEDDFVEKTQETIDNNKKIIEQSFEDYYAENTKLIFDNYLEENGVDTSDTSSLDYQTALFEYNNALAKERNELLEAYEKRQADANTELEKAIAFQQLLNNQINDFDFDVDNYNDKIKELMDASEKMAEGEALSYDELTSLIDKFPELTYSGKNGEYFVEKSALDELIEKSYEERNARIDDEIAKTYAVNEEVANRIKAYEDEKTRIENAIEENRKKYDESYDNPDLTEGILERIELETERGKLIDELNALDKEQYEADKALMESQSKYSEAYRKYLEALKGELTSKSKDKAISDGLQNQIDYYKTIISAIEIMRDKYSEAFEKEKEALKNEKKALQEGKDALKEANDERQREINLREAIINLENAKKRKVWVYSEGNGFQQVQDEKAVKEAEDKYRDAITDIQEAEIDKKIAEIDKKIEANEKQQEAFEKSLEDMTNLEKNIEDAKTVEQAKTALGLADEKDLLNLSDAVKEGIKNGLAEAIIEKDNEENKGIVDKNGNSLYTPVTLDDVLKSLGASVTAEDLKSVKNDIPTQAAYDAAVKDFVDSLNNFTENAVSSVVNNNGGVVISPTFNIYDANNPEEIAKVVNSEMTNLLTRYNNSIK